MIFATGLHSCKKKSFWILIQHFYFYSFLTYSEHIRKCSKLQIMMVFPVLIPVQNFLFPGTGRENLKCHGKGRDGKFEACIPGNPGKREFPLTPDMSIAHFDRNSPNFWGVVSKVATLQNLWVPDPAKVRRSRFRSAEIDVFRPNSWTKTLIWPISTTSTPP